ncbi:MAG: TIGR03936 family radical SAM-associated protein [bacterium]
MYRIRAKFQKIGFLCFISHLDLIRTYERAIRRANIPIQYTQGYNPKAKIIFCYPLPTGIISSSEYVDFFLCESMEISIFTNNLNKELPEDLKILEAKLINLEIIDLCFFNHLKFKISLKENLNFSQKINEFLEKDTFEILKNEKKINIKPFILELTQFNNFIFVTTKVENGTAKIEEIISGLKIPFSIIKIIERIEIFGIQENNFISPFLEKIIK